jgi:hypothetical protein
VWKAALLEEDLRSFLEKFVIEQECVRLGKEPALVGGDAVEMLSSQMQQRMAGVEATLARQDATLSRLCAVLERAGAEAPLDEAGPPRALQSTGQGDPDAPDPAPRSSFRRSRPGEGAHRSHSRASKSLCA